jgi:hypothetical protein
MTPQVISTWHWFSGLFFFPSLCALPSFFSLTFLFFVLSHFLPSPSHPESSMHEGNTEEENIGYVVFKRNIYGSARKRVRGVALLHPPPPLSTAEPVFVNLLRSPGIDSLPAGPARQIGLSYRLASLHRLAALIPRNRFLGSLNVSKYGLRLLDRYLKTTRTVFPTNSDIYFVHSCLHTHLYMNVLFDPVGRPAWVDMQMATRLRIPHTFVLHTYTKPTKCHFCNKVSSR